MSLELPSYTDGRTAITDALVENLNIAGVSTTYQQYEYLSDSIDRDAVEKDWSDADGGPLGSDTREGFQKGSISVQKYAATDHFPRPGHIIHLDVGDGAEYYIAGKPGNSRTRNEVTKGSFSVKRALHPIITNTLTEAYGQRKIATQAAGAWSILTAALTVVNSRAGSVLAYSLAAAPGYTLPGWLSINATTGVLSGTAVAGSYKVHIICTDTLTGFTNRTGFGILQFTVT